MNYKPAVTCELISLDSCKSGYRARLRRTSSHPVLGPEKPDQITFTSLIRRIDFEYGIIETLNTIYIFKVTHED